MRTSDEPGPEEVTAAGATATAVDSAIGGSSRPGPQTLVGEVGDHLTVQRHTVVLGTLTAGATLADGARLEVEGSFDGPVRLGRRAMLRVHGSYRGDSVTNHGLVVVAGVAALDSVRRRRVAVAYGSVLRGAYGESWTIDGNGHLRRLAGDTSMDVRLAAHRSAHYCLWSEATGSFLPVEELPPLT